MSQTTNSIGQPLDRKNERQKVTGGPEMDLFFVDEEDAIVNPLGVKGIGEIGTVGAAAIANAVYHATGKRIRDLPLTPDKLI